MRYETERTGRRGHPDSATDRLARGLGLFSIGLGLAQVLAPRAMSRAVGMRDGEDVMRAYGMREIANGAALLAAGDPTPWVWTRVAGDALDLATLMRASDPHERRRTYAALAAVAGVAALDLYCAATLSRESPVPLPPMRDYSNRSGFPRAPEEMRGAARDAEIPRDMRTPEALRPYAAT